MNTITYGESHDVLKPLHEFLMADPRQQSHLGSNSGHRCPKDIHDELAELKLHSTVPEKVVKVFELARNLYLYSWFVYRFSTAAELFSYAALESALKLRIMLEQGEVGWGLKQLITHAVNNVWFKDDGIRQYRRLAEMRLDSLRWLQNTELFEDNEQERLPTEWVRRLENSIPHTRNTIAHGFPLLSGSAILSMEICCDLINQLYPESNASAVLK